MRPLLAFLLLVAVPAHAKKVRVTWQPLRDQTTITFASRSDAELEATVTVGERTLGSMATSLLQIEDKSWLVQQADDGDPKVVDIGWTDRRIQTRAADPDIGLEEEVHPVSGRTYTLDVSQGELDVRPRADGPALDAIQLAGTQLAGLMEVGTLLDGRTLSAGKAVESAAVAELVGGLVGGRPKESSVAFDSLRRVDGQKVAVFTVAVALDEQTRGGPGMTMDLRGEVLLDPKTGHLLTIDVAGPVHMKGTERQDGVLFTTAIEGTLKSSTHFVWSEG